MPGDQPCPTPVTACAVGGSDISASMQPQQQDTLAARESQGVRSARGSWMNAPGNSSPYYPTPNMPAVKMKPRKAPTNFGDGLKRSSSTWV